MTVTFAYNYYDCGTRHFSLVKVNYIYSILK
jgi:hypothetical protein